MTKKQRIARHFGITENLLVYVNGRGWFYGIYFLHKSFYELQHTPAWSMKTLKFLGLKCNEKYENQDSAASSVNDA